VTLLPIILLALASSLVGVFVTLIFTSRERIKTNDKILDYVAAVNVHEQAMKAHISALEEQVAFYQGLKRLPFRIFNVGPSR